MVCNLQQGIESEPLFPSGIPREGTPKEKSREGTPDVRDNSRTVEIPESSVKTETYMKAQQGTSSEG